MSNQTKTYYANNRKYVLNSKKLTDPPVPMDLSKEITKVFDLRTRKNERISEYMCKNIRKTKLKALKQVANSDVVPSVTRPLTSKDFRIFAENCPAIEMSRFQEKYIRQKIQARGLEKQFPQLLEDIMRDTKLEFKKITHYAGINLKVKDKYPEEGFVVEGYKLLGRTKNYKQFLWFRDRLKMRWILHYAVMKKLLNECVSTLPYELFRIQINKLLDLKDLQYIFKDKIQYTAAFLHDIYKKISAILDKDEDICKQSHIRLLPACTGLYSVYVSRSIAHTMESVVKFTESLDNPPYLKLYVDYEESLVLSPTAEEVTQNFYQFLDDLINAGKELYVLEKGRIKGNETKTICLCLTEEFVNNCKRHISQNITRLYEPVLKYLDKLGADFGEVYSDINSESFFRSISDILFEDGCKKIEYYKKYIHKVAYIPDNEYFKIGQLRLTTYREKLHDSLQMITDSIFRNLSFQHLWEVNDICDSFTLIKIRATRKPITTEELIEIGKFMTWVRDEQLDNLNQRVYDSLSSLCNIITLGLLDEDHMAANSAAINWLDEIIPIVEQHAVNYEQLKFEAEEKLQKVIEDINVLITDVYPLLVILDEMDNIKLTRKYLHGITLHMNKIKGIRKQIDWINNEEVCLSFPKSNYAEFENLKDYVYPFYHLLKLCLDVQKHVSVWQYGPFDLLDYDSTKVVVEKLCKELTDLQKDYKKKLRQAQDENLPIRFKGTVDDPDILNWPAPLKLGAHAYKMLEDFKPSLTVMQIMCNDCLRSRHWKAMSEIAGFNLTPNAGTTLKKIMEIDLKDKLHEYEIISTGATKEQQLLDNLDSLKKEWENIQFSVTKSKEEVSILTHLEDVETVVNDHMIKVLNMRGSVFVKPCETEVLQFYNSLLNITFVLVNWRIIQKDYLKFLPIFSIDDVGKHIPKEKSLFDQCNLIFTVYIRKIMEDPVVMNIICHTEIVVDLEKCLGKLEEVQKGFNNYLEVVRLNCPRLFYISNEELINLIAKNGDISNQNFIIKIFPGFSQVRVIESNEIVCLISLLQEEIILRNPITVSSAKTLDDILTDLENEMINTIKYKCAECYKIFRKTDLKELVKKFPQQSLQLMAQVYWTDQVENALKLSHNIKLLIYKRKLQGHIKAKIKILNENDITSLEREIIKNLLLVDLNNRFILSCFLKQGLVINENHFDWQVQLRYYFEKSLCTVTILQNSFMYGYEYLGNSGQIILTPMTVRCFRTLVNAYFLNFFGLVRGKSETGKSITLKGLSEALGLLYFSFSCTKNISIEVLGQILKGTVLCGSWLALENIEYVKPDVFSVISQELLNILEAKKQEAKKVVLGGMPLNLDSRCFICGITNSENKVELPENLKVLLRTFTLCKPDVVVLAEIFFISQGVKHPKNLAKKLNTCFSLLEDVLSFQRQYCFGLRGLKNVLTTFELEAVSISSAEDGVLLCNSIRKVFGKCLIASDHKVFEEILSDIFQENSLPVQAGDDKEIKETLIKICNQLNFSTYDNFSKKVFDVYNLLKARSNILIVGDSYSGKTTVLKVCAKIFEELEQLEVSLYYINPKCLNYNELIGKISQEKNQEWTDGILLRIFRDSQKNNSKSRHSLIVVDGHIDPSWAEHFSGILEEGKVFLESQEMFLISSNITFVMEATDLKDCSPAMVSRCEITYFPSSTLKLTAIVDFWLKTCQSLWLMEYSQQIGELFKWFIPPCLEALQTLKCNCELDDNTLVKNTLIYFQLILDDATSKVNRKEEDPKNMSTWIHATFLQAGILSFFSILDYSSRQKFDEYYKQLWRGQNENYPYPKCIERLDVSVPQDGILFEYCYLYKQRGAWKLWVDLLKNEKIVESQYLSSCIIPTVDTMRCNFLLDLHVQYAQSFLIVGPHSTGRSLALKDCFVNRLKERQFETSFITFNAAITSSALQSCILSKLNKRKSGYYSPSAGRRFVFFIDDLQCSHRDSFGIFEAAELLRQHFDHNTWYDRTTSEKIYFNKTNFIASMRTGNSNSLPKRFLRHFNVFGINEFTSDTIAKIYSQSLFHVWKKAGFPGDIANVVNQIVNATLHIFTLIQKNLKSTLSKCQYVFDLTSFSKVMYGCSFLKKETYDVNKKIYLRLWVHEMIRVFADRFDIADIKWLSNHLKDCISDHFSEDFEEIFGNNYERLHIFSKLFFGTFNGKHLRNGLRQYEEVNFNNLTEICHQCLCEYNEKSRYKLDLIFFDYALEKLARICRILTIPHENALLLGLTGCGKQSLSKFASFMYKHEFYQPVMTRTYDLNSWNQEFKEIFKRSGGMNKECTFLISEEELIDERFLEIIDFFIRDGELTDLYTLDEKQEILELSRLAAQGGNRNLDISSHRVFLYFNKKCRENLHILLCLNSGSDTLRKRILTYPSLVNRFNVMLWKDWPDNALQGVGHFSIKEVNIPDEIKDKTIKAAVYFHRTSQGLSQLQNFVTPKAYIHLMKLFSDLIIKKQSLLTKKKDKFLRGLAKLSYAEEQIFKMQKALAEYQPQLEAMTRNAIEMTQEIASETIQIEKASALVRKDEKIASEQAAVAQILKSECESELAQAIPILEDAISALNTLKPTDITLVKSMKNPPDAIKLVMASVCVIKDVKPDRIPDPSTGRKSLDYWGPSKRILGDMNFLQALKEFDKDHIKPEIMAKIRKEYLPHKDFKPHVVAKASSAAEGLCKWIIAMDMYDRVAKEVAPKKEKLNKAEKEYAGTMKVLNEKMEEVVRIEAKLAQLHVLLDEATIKQNKLQIEVDLCNKKLGSAQKLIGGLSGEQLVWTEASKNLQKHYDVLAGDIILSSAVIGYLAPLSKEVRREVMKKWHEYLTTNEIPTTSDFDFSQVLSNEVEIEHWGEYGLSMDSFYVENAVIFNQSKNFCLFLDPQGQAVNWILTTEARSNLTVTKFSFKDWLSSLKYCIANGKPILIKDTKGYIPPCLYYLLYRQTFTQDEDVYVTIGDENVKLNNKSRLYIVCTHPKVPYNLEIRSRLTILNFGLINSALEEDPLKIVIEIEKPEIQKLTKELISKNRENKAELKDLEIKILDTLCESEVDILEDEESIVILDKSKELVRIIKEKQEESKKIKNSIKDFKKGYVQVAKYVTDLFFCLNDLQKLHHFYQFSMDWFKNLYFISIINAGKSRLLEIRCQKLCETFTYDMYKSVSKGLFEKDKLLFTLWLASGVAVSKKLISREELSMFLGTERFFEAKNTFKKPSWVADEIWINIQKLEVLETFKGIVKHFVENEHSWKKYSESISIEIPKPWNTVNDFSKLIILKVLRPEKLYYGIIDFIKSALGDQFLAPIFFNMQEIYNETYSLAPTIFILTPGIDILRTVHTFASIKQVLHKFSHLSMSDKSFEQADKLIKEGQIGGSWVLLQNCQLAKQWLDYLEQKLETYDFENTHENFRLFLTTEPQDNFPLELVQNSIKIVNEPPNILRKNLLKTYNQIPIISDEFFYGCPGKQDIFSKLLYCFCHFHFVMQERQKILNWNIPYRFKENDLLISLEQLRNIVNGEICIFEKIYSLLGECNYSGYLEYAWEKQFLIEVLHECVNKNIFEKGATVFNGAKKYGLPNKNDRQDYLKHMFSLPPQDDPQVLYLSEYEFLRHKIVKTKEFLNSGLKMVQCDKQYVLSRDEFRILSIVDDLLKIIPKQLIIRNIDGLYQFIKREIQLYTNLLGKVKSSLEYLRSALGGDDELTSDFEELAKDLAKNRFPRMWQRYSYPSLLNLSNFVKDFIKKINYFENFIYDERRFWLGAFFFPRALIASIKIEFSKKEKVSLDCVSLNYKVLSKLDVPKVKSDIILDKLFLLGAKFDTDQNQLTELAPKTYYDTLPPLLIKPVVLSDVKSDVDDNDFKCYIFKTEALPDNYKNGSFLPGCQNYVTEVSLPCENDGGFWVRRGVNIVCEMNQSTAEELFNMSSPEVAMVEEQAAQELMERSMLGPEERVFARSQQIQPVAQAPMIQTPAGMERVLQQTFTEKRVQRDEHSETIVKNLAVTDLDENTGEGNRVTISEQQLDPEYGLPGEGTDVVTVKETVTVTPSYTSSVKDVTHETVTPKIDINPEELAQLVEDENEDVENTLKMAPPDLTLKEDSYAVKRRLQKLRLNTESMILLEESVVNPAPTADEAMVETPPEALANIMHTVENGVTPECAPDRIFHTLFEEKLTEQSIILSSIGPGPMQDVVVPQTFTKDIHKEPMTHDLTDLTNIYKNVTDAKDWPPVDIFDSVMDPEKKSPKKGRKARKFKPLKDEEMPWKEEDLEPIVNIVGAEPSAVLDPANVPELETSGNLEKELTQGIEYFVDADPVQYMSRVQLRGSHPPKWFPGYIYTLPEFPDLIKLARNPDEVFVASWRSCQPKLIPDTSMSILP